MHQDLGGLPPQLNYFLGKTLTCTGRIIIAEAVWADLVAHLL